MVSPHAPARFRPMLTLTVPGLLGHGAAFTAARSAHALARYADAPTQERHGLGIALCSGLALPRATPLAPLCALGAGVSVDDSYVMAATPVTLVADRDIVVLAGRVADLREDEAATLIALLNRHFASDGIAFEAPRPSAWFVRSERDFALSTSSVDAAIGRAIAEFLPRGGDAMTWQRWQVEIQMLLHEHAINGEREDRGLAVVSGVWLSGNGRLRDIAKPRLTNVFAVGGESGDLARGLARHVGLSADALPSTLSAILGHVSSSANILVAMDRLTDQAMMAHLDAHWLQPAVDALEAGAIDTLQLIADGHGVAVTWRARRPSGLARVTSRLRNRSLEIPARVEE
jgi:hypothetical protein